MDKSYKELLEIIERKWPEPIGLIAAELLATVAFSLILNSADIKGWLFLLLVLLLAAAVAVAWALGRRLKRTPKDKLGFYVSLYCPNDQESIRLREDFIQPLRQLVKSGRAGPQFFFYEIPRFRAKQIEDLEQARRLQTKVRALFLIYGSVRQRIINGEERHVIELNGIVGHAPVNDQAQQFLRREFSELFFPGTVSIARENDLFLFKFTSQWADVVSRYIMGLAVSFSGNFDYAEQLYLDAKERLQAKDQNFQIFQKLNARIPQRISELYRAKANISHTAWTKTHDPRAIDQMGEALKRVIPEDKPDVQVLTLGAIGEVVQNRNTKEARRLLNLVPKDRRDGTWHYNMAFLDAYEEDLTGAYRHYQLAALDLVQPSVIEQVEDFLCQILEIEPDKVQLHFCLGFFNWHTKGDYERARGDFERFLEKADEQRFAAQIRVVKKWIGELEAKNQTLGRNTPVPPESN